MKVIKEGILPETRTYRCNCDRCGCLFEFIEAEARRCSDQRDGDYLTIACPTCGIICYTTPKRLGEA